MHKVWDFIISIFLYTQVYKEWWHTSVTPGFWKQWQTDRSLWVKVQPAVEIQFQASWYSMNNKNPETDIGAQAERSEKQSSQPLESSYLYKIFRLKRERVPVSSPLLFLSSVRIKGGHHRPISMANYYGCWDCRCVPPLPGLCGWLVWLALHSDLQASFIKTQIKGLERWLSG